MSREQLQTELDSFLHDLCDLFDEELERQNLVLVACQAQGEAARAHDLEYLEARTASLTILMEESFKAEEARLKLLRKVVEQLGLNAERQTLSDLISAAPEPWRLRMAGFQSDIRSTLAKIRTAVRSNSRYMRSTLRRVNKTVDTFTGTPHEYNGSYDAAGAESSRRGHAAFLIDAVG